MTQNLQQRQDAYFAEFQTRCRKDLQYLNSEMKRWNAHSPLELLRADLNTQATFADYVIQKMCQSSTTSELKMLLGPQCIWPQTPDELTTSSIGNMALLALRIQDAQTIQTVTSYFATQLEKHTSTLCENKNPPH